MLSLSKIFHLNQALGSRLIYPVAYYRSPLVGLTSSNVMRPNLNLPPVQNPPSNRFSSSSEKNPESFHDRQDPTCSHSPALTFLPSSHRLSPFTLIRTHCLSSSSGILIPGCSSAWLTVPTRSPTPSPFSSSKLVSISLYL